MYTLGIDIGGTHTDGIIINHAGQKLAWAKTATTTPLTEGVQKLIAQLTQSVNPAQIGNVILGTTHATNAILEAKGLLKVGLLRLSDSLPKSPTVGFGWPSLLKNAAIAGMESTFGGYDFNGRPSSRFNRSQVQKAIAKLLDQKAEAISVVSAFATINGSQENEVAEIIAAMAGNNFPVTLSHQIGGIGFIERENATLLNSALKNVMSEGFGSIAALLLQYRIKASLWMTQNNGSIVNMEEAIAFPIKTIGAGLTNSFIGATKLVGVADAVVVDIGGTSTDIGVVEGGYARTSLHAATIGGIALHCALPDILSLPLGGGSILNHCPTSGWQIGPHSVAKELTQLSQVFGGSTLTLTDAGVVAGKLPIANDRTKIFLTVQEGDKILSQICHTIHRAVIRLRGKKQDLPVIVVGGAAPLLQKLYTEFQLAGTMPELGGIANAFGAALAEVSASVNVVVSLDNREKTLNELKEQALRKACEKGADPAKVRIAQLSAYPLTYASGNLAKVSVLASGPRLFPCQI